MRMATSLRTISGFVLATVLATLCSGCGLTVAQKSAIQKFGAATADLSTVAGDELRQSRQEYLQMTDLQRELKDDPGDVERILNVEQTKTRTDALDALKAYG